jgi:hypothetical protein
VGSSMPWLFSSDHDAAINLIQSLLKFLALGGAADIAHLMNRLLISDTSAPNTFPFRLRIVRFEKRADDQRDHRANLSDPIVQ